MWWGQAMKQFHDWIQCTAGLGYQLTDYVRGLGKDPTPDLARVGFSVDTFEKPFKRISLDRFTKLFELFAISCNDEAFGLHFAESFVSGDTGALGLAMANAPSLREAQQFFISSVELISDC